MTRRNQHGLTTQDASLIGMPISTVLIPIAAVVIGIWLLRKILNIGLLLVIGAALVAGWWFFLVD